jgi:hypothetical protein
VSGNDSRVAWELLFIFNLTLLFSGGCIIQTPDTPLLLFWTIALYGCTQVFTGGERGWWYVTGAAFGLGLLSKYTMVLMIPCVFAVLLVSPPHRHWLLRKEPYMATLLGALLFFPVIVWNIEHRWASAAFQLSQGFSPVRGSTVAKLLEYLGGQIGVVTPLLFLAFLYYSFWGLFCSRQRRSSEVLYLAILSWPILIFFGASTLRGEVAEPNWPAPAYITGLPLMWIVYRRDFQDRPGHKKFMKASVGLALIMNLAVHVHLARPIFPLPRGMDPFWQFYGWRELGESIEAHVKAHPCEEGTFLVGEGPPTVAEAVFYTGNRYVGLDFTRPGRYAFLRCVDQLKGKNAIILSQDSSASTLERLNPYFEEVVFLGRHRYYYRGEMNKRLSFYILLGKEFRGNWRPSI